ncbi:hypothetical protein [Rariglobus hedericola]|uniref:Glycoside hydrolase family 42 N-terminal domain-containing protein n=1 Tax=Rariglobus hedericola TaxID=2597822 RepID=A0A556QSF7_9BACT|nr:hypothetical protein [Rariglobus hedericola]TSJ79574.1 hypothetical protein FPL22_09895 [Rariglobus hedericola]
MIRLSQLLALSSIALGLLLPALPAAPESVRIGVLQPKPSYAQPLADAGVSLVVLSISWENFEPSTGTTNPAYIRQLHSDLAAYRHAGLHVVLDPGIQYPPEWLRQLPDARYQNQYGDLYIDHASGKNIANTVFNAAVRTRYAAHLAALFRELGTDWAAVRLGGGWYGELNYPDATFAKKNNCYWAFDPIAQGTKPGLPAGMTACPVPNWKPGKTSPDHTSARRFLDWYLASLQNYHDWQITTVRQLYSGPLHMMYPSWGIRPGQLEAAIIGDLGGTTSPEKNGEIQRGFDFARFIAGVRDPQVWVHCTWLDSNPAWSDDTSPDPVRWSPPKFLAHLARLHSPALNVSAENTGGGGLPALALSARRIQELKINTLFWAFAPDLFDDHPPELKDLATSLQK